MMLRLLPGGRFEVSALNPAEAQIVWEARDQEPVIAPAFTFVPRSVGEAEDYRFYWRKGWKAGSPSFLGKENPQWKHNYAVRYWLTDLAQTDPTDSVVRSRVYFALRRAGIPLSIPAHSLFLTEEDEGRRTRKSREETERRWQATTPQWPIMHAVLYGVTRDQMMARHKSNHVQVAYAPDGESANKALAVKAAMFREMGLAVSICGSDHGLG